MVNIQDVWKEAYLSKMQADRMWDRVYQEKKIEMLLSAIITSNSADKKLLRIEKTMREENK